MNIRITYVGSLTLMVALLVLWQVAHADEGDNRKLENSSRFQIRLLNGTAFSFDTGTLSAGPFTACLKNAVNKDNEVPVAELNKCASESLKEFQTEITRRFQVGNINDFGRLFRNLSNVETLNRNLIEHIGNVQSTMRSLHIPLDNTLFTSTLERATATLRNVTNLTQSTLAVRNAQNIMDDFNRTLHRVGTLAQTSGAVPPVDINTLTTRLQEGIGNLRNLTANLPAPAQTQNELRRITEMTVGNFTHMMQNITRGLPEVIKRIEPLREQSAKQIRDFMTALNQNVRDMSQAVTQNANTSRVRDAGEDVQRAFDGFQKAISTAGNAFQDLIRGAMQITTNRTTTTTTATGTAAPPEESTGNAAQDFVRRTGLSVERFIGGLFGRRPTNN